MSTEKIRYEVITQTDKGDVLIPIPPVLLAKLNWKEGDSIEIVIDENGRYVLKRLSK